MGHPPCGDRDDEDAAFVARMAMVTMCGHTETVQVGFGNHLVADSEGVAAVVGVFADEVVAVVEIARMMVPYPARIRCRRLDFPVGHCRRVLCRGKPAPHSRRLLAHRRDHDP